LHYLVNSLHCASKEAAEKYIKKIEEFVPESGKINILVFTDKQYENIITFNGKKEKSNPKNPEQYKLF